MISSLKEEGQNFKVENDLLKDPISLNLKSWPNKKFIQPQLRRLETHTVCVLKSPKSTLGQSTLYSIFFQRSFRDFSSSDEHLILKNQIDVVFYRMTAFNIANMIENTAILRP